jgi:hypothetical protein
MCQKAREKQFCLYNHCTGDRQQFVSEVSLWQPGRGSWRQKERTRLDV